MFTSGGVQLFWDLVIGLLELLEEGRGDGEEVNTRKCLDFSNL